MEKRDMISAVIANLEKRLALLTDAANEAKAGANDAESRQESKYDTRGLEAGYLAQGQAQEAALLSDAIASVTSVVPRTFSRSETVAIGALVHVRQPGGTFAYLLLPAGGGTEVAAREGDREVTVLTPAAPLGKKLLGARLGDLIRLAPGAPPAEITAIE